MRTETFTLFKGRKEALASTREGHVEKEYEILSDVFGGNGLRVLTLKPKDLTEINSLRRELVDKIAERLGEASSRTLRAILLDTLADYSESSVRRMRKKLFSKGGERVRVKSGPGCFFIALGDGRKKSGDIIRVRD